MIYGERESTQHKLIGRRQTSQRDSHADTKRRHGVSERKEKERKRGIRSTGSAFKVIHAMSVASSDRNRHPLTIVT